MEEIKEIDMKTDEWTVVEVSKIYRDTFNNYFSENINKKSYKTFAKEWHKNIKLMCNYSNNKGILDLQNGPIAKFHDFRLAQEKKIGWD